jgi:hypothetical protein
VKSTYKGLDRLTLSDLKRLNAEAEKLLEQTEIKKAPGVQFKKHRHLTGS